MTESTISHSAFDPRRVAVSVSRRTSRTLRATAVAAIITTAGAAWNGAFVAGTVWLLAAATGRSASPGLLLDLAATVSAVLVIPIGLVVGFSIRAWLKAEDRLVERRLAFVRR